MLICVVYPQSEVGSDTRFPLIRTGTVRWHPVLYIAMVSSGPLLKPTGSHCMETVAK